MGVIMLLLFVLGFLLGFLICADLCADLLNRKGLFDDNGKIYDRLALGD